MAGATLPGYTTGKTFRPDAGAYMSDSEYQAWRYSQAGATRVPGTTPKTPAGGLYPGSPETTLSPNPSSPSTPTPYAAPPLAPRLAGTSGGGGTGGGGYPGVTDPNALSERERLELEARYAAEADARQAAAAQASMNASAGLQGAAEQRRLGYLPQFQGGGGPSAPTVQYGDAGADAARNASFARAKDKAGQIARASLTGLRNAMGERGIGGSGIEALQSAGIVGAAGSELGEVNREQLLQDLAQQQHIQDLTYQGGITQRGQTLAAQSPERQALMGLITARGLY